MTATEVRGFDATIPAGTAIATPVKIDLDMPPREVDFIEAVVPAGFRGLVGWRITQGGNPVIPYDSALWLITDNERIRWELDGLNNSGTWMLVGYNTDVWDHTVHLRFGVHFPDEPARPGVALLPLDVLNAAV